MSGGAAAILMVKLRPGGRHVPNGRGHGQVQPCPMPRHGVRSAPAYSAASTRVLSAKYNPELRKALSRFPQAGRPGMRGGALPFPAGSSVSVSWLRTGGRGRFFRRVAQKVFNNDAPVRCQYRFRVKLDPSDIKHLMPQSHNIPFATDGSHLQAIRQTFLVYHP